MNLTITPENCRAMYAYLSTTPPFNKWNLPEAEDVVFKTPKVVLKDNGCYGCCYAPKHKTPTIEISPKLHASSYFLMLTMAHEMVHLYQGYHGMKTSTPHGPAFKKLAQQVCTAHIFDPAAF